MLDQSDLKILGEMFLASEERMMKRMDEKIDELDARLSARIDELDELQSGRIDELDTRLSGRIDSLEVQMKKSENLFMTELGRTCDYLERKIDAVQKDVNELKEYYRIQRLEDSNTATLLRLYTGLRAEVDELKVKIA